MNYEDVPVPPRSGNLGPSLGNCCRDLFSSTVRKLIRTRVESVSVARPEIPIDELTTTAP